MTDTADSVDAAAGVVTSLNQTVATLTGTKLNLMNWFLITGLVIVLSGIWYMILHEFKKEG